jgi:DNA polymerase-3 subunit delta'
MSFKDIKGQDKPLNLLKNYIEQGKLQGGFLFTGQEGVGKKLAAKQLAKQVNCLKQGLDTCDECVSCRKIENNQHPDVHIIELADAEIKIEYIRELQKEISFRPYEGKKKVFIIDNAHRLTGEAQNAILKILEEPPRDSLIILISDKPSLMFKTIISRCKIFRFFSLPRTELEGIFKNDYKLTDNLAHFLAYFCEGRPGYALRLKDKDILREKNNIIDGFILSRRFNLDNLSVQDREYVRSMLNILASWFRDIYLVKIGMPYSEIINFDRRQDLLKLMPKFSFTDLNEIFDSISDSMQYLEQNINIRLLLHNLGSQLWKD